SGILELFSQKNLWGIQTKILGLPDTFMEHGTQAQLRHKGNIDVPAIIVEALALCGKKGPAREQ
ncbi:MAG: hypothetical protein KKG34_06660, partial [Proteobacteria bacterium]|nr:hypothetical protein [Pseudomonadota bacterium]